jgi:hypothetical protein
MSTLGRSRCRWAVLVVVGLFSLSSSPPRRRSALRVVVEPAMPSFGPLVSSFGPLVLSFGPLCLRLAHPDVLRPFVLSCGRLCRHSAVPGCCDLGQWRRGTRGGRKRATTSVVARSRYAPAGPPIAWVPPLVLPTPPRYPPLSGPTSLSGGEGHRGA